MLLTFIHLLLLLFSYIGYQYSARELLDMVETRSVWTIDLAFLLRRSCPELCFLFCSTTLGVAETHSTLEMYEKEFDADSERCKKLFQTAQEAGVFCLERSLDGKELARLMLATRRVLLILLVDINRINSGRTNRYTGHYIIVCGYDSVTQEYSYLDPALTSTVKTITSHGLDEARCCEGTDEDIIIIQIPQDLISNKETESYANDGLEGWRRTAFEVSDHFFDNADTFWTSIVSGISSFGRHEDPEGNELKIL